MKTNLNAIIFGVAIIVASIFLGKSYVERKNVDGKIQVTGLGKTDFTSDLIVWEGKFSAESFNLKEAYTKLKNDQEVIKSYLISKGVSYAKNLVFNAVQTQEKTKSNYSANGKFIGSIFSGYLLTQTIQIESNEVEKIERISRGITDLLHKGVQFYSETPRYYYTKLSDLKIEMISKATEDARIRAEKISEFSGGKLGNLKSAKMGIFQITGQNSKENHSWGGTFNTSSKEKTASITMKLIYNIK